MRGPGHYDLHVYRGDTEGERISIRNEAGPVDLTGCTFAAQIRKGPDGIDAVATLTIIPVDLAEGSFRVWLPPDQSANLEPGCAWDLEITWPEEVAPGIPDVRTVLAGAVCLQLDVTKPEQP